MKIIIIGCGKVGSTLAEQLSKEDHDITIIDTIEEKLQSTVDRLDVIGIKGNGATIPVLQEADVEHTDLLIAATAADELNLLSCLIAKKAGAKNTIARVRNPEYTDVLAMIKPELGLSLSINPEMACAMEIARVLKFPSMIKVDTFAKGRVELLQFKVDENSPLVNMKLRDINRFGENVLICAAERDSEADGVPGSPKNTGHTNIIIPSGDFTIKAGDRLSLVGDPYQENQFFNAIGIKSGKVKSVMMVGGGRIAYYLARILINNKVSVKIIENNMKRCRELADLLPEAVIIYGDGADQSLLLEEGVERYDAFAALTGLDEENIMLSLFVGKVSKAKLVTKITRNPFTTVLSGLNLGSIFYPRIIAAEHILRYVRAMQSSYGSNVKALSKIVDERAEALEFLVNDNCSLSGIPIMELKLKKNLLIGIINRKGHIIIPNGRDFLETGDTVIVITTVSGLNKLEDILA